MNVFFSLVLRVNLSTITVHVIQPIGRKTEEGLENYASQSISAVLMVVFEYSDNLGELNNFDPSQ